MKMIIKIMNAVLRLMMLRTLPLNYNTSLKTLVVDLNLIFVIMMVMVMMVIIIERL